MPRFVARPITIEAHQYAGHNIPQMPEAFRLAVTRRLLDGTIEVATGYGPRVCKYHDWLVRGPDGQITVMHDAAFEAMFEERQPVPEQVAAQAAQATRQGAVDQRANRRR